MADFLRLAIHEHTKIISLNKEYSYFPGNSKGFRSSVSEAITQKITTVLGALCKQLGGQIFEHVILLVSLCTRVLDVLCQELGKRANIYFYYITISQFLTTY
jgi:hypothetical protein